MRAGNGARHEGVRRRHSKACRLWQRRSKAWELGPVCAHGGSGHHTMQWCARGGCGVASCAWHVRSAVHDGGVWRACTRGGARGGQSREVREAPVSHGGDSTFYLFSRGTENVLTDFADSRIAGAASCRARHETVRTRSVPPCPAPLRWTRSGGIVAAILRVVGACDPNRLRPMSDVHTSCPLPSHRLRFFCFDFLPSSRLSITELRKELIEAYVVIVEALERLMKRAEGEEEGEEDSARRWRGRGW